jgi:CheY-like chemotaxis protein
MYCNCSYELSGTIIRESEYTDHGFLPDFGLPAPMKNAATETPLSSAKRSNPRIPRKAPGVARVLVADSNPAARLTLKTVLEAGGYRVDAAASAAEALGLLDRSEYALVLSDLAMESPEAGLKVLAHAQMKEYRPATALITASHHRDDEYAPASNGRVLVEPQDLPEFLGKVATLVGNRATKHANRAGRRTRTR